MHIVDATAPGIRLQDSNAVNSDFEIYSPDGVNNLRIAKAGTDFMALDSSGVGIGTTSPSSLLHLQSTGTPKILVQDSDGTNTYGEFYHDGGSTYIASRAGSGNGSLIVGGSGGGSFDEHLRIDASGNVGIGNTSPSHKLDVVAGVGDNFPVEFNGDSGVSGYLYSDSGGAGMFNGSAVAGSEGIYLQSTTGFASFYTNGSERMRINSSGDVGIGTDNPQEILHASSGSNPAFHLTNTDGTNGGTIRIVAATNGAFIGLKSPSGGFDALRFGTGNEVERMRIDSNGDVMINNGSAASVGARLTIVDGDSGLNNSIMNTGYTGTGMLSTCERSASSAYFFFAAVSGRRVDNASGDTEFSVRGDGEVFADGGAINTGADYAEYFEWNDGNPSDEDRVGYAVSLVGNKIKIAESGEEVIGVISGNPSVVGDAAWNKWQHKYLKDDFGRYSLDSNGHRQLNPDYDDSLEYQPREDRQEWDVVGLMGKLRVRVGQQTNSNWIKLRDISDTVEEWLVR